MYINCACAAFAYKEIDEEKFNGKKLYESFYDILKNSNFKILKCYKLVFSGSILKKILVILLSYLFFPFILYI